MPNFNKKCLQIQIDAYINIFSVRCSHIHHYKVVKMMFSYALLICLPSNYQINNFRPW